jgi:hypothetical protein
MARIWGVWLFLAPMTLLGPAVSRAQNANGPPGSSLPTGSIQGTVSFLNDQGKSLPLQGVHLRLSSTLPALSTVTDATGSYEFKGLGGNTYTLEVSRRV